MFNPHIIVWDLDDTIGDFHALEDNCESNSVVSVFTRPGLITTLETLRQLGFINSLLTMATSVYAEIALWGTGLYDLFDRIECRGQRRKGDVEGIATAFGIDTKDCPHQIIFIGDKMVFDEPDNPNVVFHLEPFAMNRPAIELQHLILYLRAVGNGSFREGFSAILRENRKWYRFFRPISTPMDKPIIRSVPTVGELVLMERNNACPVIGFYKFPNRGNTPDEHKIIPIAVLATSNAQHRL